MMGDPNTIENLPSLGIDVSSEEDARRLIHLVRQGSLNDPQVVQMLLGTTTGQTSENGQGQSTPVTQATTINTQTSKGGGEKVLQARVQGVNTSFQIEGQVSGSSLSDPQPPPYQPLSVENPASVVQSEPTHSSSSSETSPAYDTKPKISPILVHGEASNHSDVFTFDNGQIPAYLGFGSSTQPISLDDEEPQLIIDLPDKYSRFRYETEKTSKAGGSRKNVDQIDAKPLLSLVVKNYQGVARVVMYCVDKDWRPHPFQLEGEHCEHGVYEGDIFFQKGRMCSFTKLGIISPVKKEYGACIKLRREKLKACSFRDVEALFQKKDFKCCDNKKIYIVAEVKLNSHPSEKTQLMAISPPIQNKKDGSEFKIYRVEPACAPATGKRGENDLYSDKILIVVTDGTCFPKKVEVIFKDVTGQWSQVVQQDKMKIIKKAVIELTPPPYRDPSVPNAVTVNLILRDADTGDETDPVQFVYRPAPAIELQATKKRKLEEQTTDLMVTSSERQVQETGSDTANRRANLQAARKKIVIQGLRDKVQAVEANTNHNRVSDAGTADVPMATQPSDEPKQKIAPQILLYLKSLLGGLEQNKMETGQSPQVKESSITQQHPSQSDISATVASGQNRPLAVLNAPSVPGTQMGRQTTSGQSAVQGMPAELSFGNMDPQMQHKIIAERFQKLKEKKEEHDRLKQRMQQQQIQQQQQPITVPQTTSGQGGFQFPKAETAPSCAEAGHSTLQFTNTTTPIEVEPITPTTDFVNTIADIGSGIRSPATAVSVSSPATAVSPFSPQQPQPSTYQETRVQTQQYQQANIQISQPQQQVSGIQSGQSLQQHHQQIAQLQLQQQVIQQQQQFVSQPGQQKSQGQQINMSGMFFSSGSLGQQQSVSETMSLQSAHSQMSVSGIKLLNIDNQLIMVTETGDIVQPTLQQQLQYLGQVTSPTTTGQQVTLQSLPSEQPHSELGMSFTSNQQQSLTEEEREFSPSQFFQQATSSPTSPLNYNQFSNTSSMASGQLSGHYASSAGPASVGVSGVISNMDDSDLDTDARGRRIMPTQQRQPSASSKPDLITCHSLDGDDDLETDTIPQTSGPSTSNQRLQKDVNKLESSMKVMSVESNSLDDDDDLETDSAPEQSGISPNQGLAQKEVGEVKPSLKTPAESEAMDDDDFEEDSAPRSQTGPVEPVVPPTKKEPDRTWHINENAAEHLKVVEGRNLRKYAADRETTVNDSDSLEDDDLDWGGGEGMNEVVMQVSKKAVAGEDRWQGQLKSAEQMKMTTRKDNTCECEEDKLEKEEDSTQVSNCLSPEKEEFQEQQEGSDNLNDSAIELGDQVEERCEKCGIQSEKNNKMLIGRNGSGINVGDSKDNTQYNSNKPSSQTGSDESHAGER